MGSPPTVWRTLYARNNVTKRISVNLQNIDRRRAANCKSANQPPKAHHPSDGGLQLSREAILAPNGGFGDPIPGQSPALADAPPPEPLTVKIRTCPYFTGAIHTPRNRSRDYWSAGKIRTPDTSATICPLIYVLLSPLAGRLALHTMVFQIVNVMRRSEPCPT